MNKHKVVAIFMVPFLALGGWILADIYGSSNDKIIKDKKLVVTNVCKPLSDQCEILGIGLKLSLNFKIAPSYQRLLPISLTSEKNSLDDVSMSLLINEKETSPVKLLSMSDDRKRWETQIMPFSIIKKDNLRIRLVVSYKASLHFAEFPVYLD